MTVNWPETWSPIEDSEEAEACNDELVHEVRKGHPLFGLPVTAVGRSYEKDEVLFELEDGTGRVAEVHLTWNGAKEKPPSPRTTLSASLAAWLQSKGSSA